VVEHARRRLCSSSPNCRGRRSPRRSGSIVVEHPAPAPCRVAGEGAVRHGWIGADVAVDSAAQFRRRVVLESAVRHCRRAAADRHSGAVVFAPVADGEAGNSAVQEIAEFETRTCMIPVTIVLPGPALEAPDGMAEPMTMFSTYVPGSATASRRCRRWDTCPATPECAAWAYRVRGRHSRRCRPRCTRSPPRQPRRR